MRKKRVLKIGLPKGSLQESTFNLFSDAGFNISCSERSYFPSIDDSELEPYLLRAQEMSRYIEDGALDCGITGKDWVEENSSDVKILEELPYAKRTLGKVRWVIAVRDDSSIRSVKDLQGKRIATEIVNVTKKFLRKEKVHAEVEFSWGATEVKVKAGLVDAIVELTETGASLRANNLRVVKTVCESVTCFIANKSSYRDPWCQKKIKSLLILLKSAMQAQGMVGLKMNLPQKNLERILKVLPSLNTPTVSGLVDKKWVALEVVVKEDEVKRLIPLLKENGAEGIFEFPLNKLVY